MRRVPGWIAAIALLAGGCGAIETSSPTPITDEELGARNDTMSVALSSGDYDVYVGKDIREAMQPDGTVPADWESPYSVVHVPAVLAQQAFERKRTGAGDRIITRSFCDPSNGFSVTEHYVGVVVERRGAERTFVPGASGVYGAMNVEALPDAEGALRAGYAITFVDGQPGAGLAVSTSTVGAASDSVPEDPTVEDCIYSPSR